MTDVSVNAGSQSILQGMPQLTLPSFGMIADLRELITKQVIPLLEGLDPTPLTLENVKSLPSGLQGVYLLTYRGEDVFLGVADQSRDMRKRLLRDYHEVQHRYGVDPTAVGFRAVQWVIE